MIPPGAEILSDPIAFEVKANHDLTVIVYTGGSTGPTTWHALGMQTSYVSTSGDHISDTAPSAYTPVANSWFWLDGVDVLSSPSVKGAIVHLGDSITDGYGSTPNANHRWPDYLAQRFQQGAPGQVMSVLDAGISGNKILRDSPISMRLHD